ncbi:hypothetical protein MYX76_16615, partial [Desulfobacterota bacterium AH_259_B03_O07]|nr:hypothetical protein [Desulfobacterota bacterium AH_259_B03_O07]
ISSKNCQVIYFFMDVPIVYYCLQDLQPNDSKSNSPVGILVELNGISVPTGSEAIPRKAISIHNIAPGNGQRISS